MPKITLQQILNPAGAAGRPVTAAVPVSAALNKPDNELNEPTAATAGVQPQQQPLQMQQPQPSTVQQHFTAPTPAQPLTQQQKDDFATAVAASRPTSVTPENVRQAASTPPATMGVGQSAKKNADGTDSFDENHFVNWYVKNHNYHQPTPEEQAEQAKIEKRNKVINAIGDGLSALSNIYFTTKGAPSQTLTPTLSSRQHDRWAALQEQAEKERDEYFKGLQRAQQLDLDATDKYRNWRRLLDKDRAEQDRKDAIADAQRGRYNAAAAKDAGMAAYYDAKVKALEEGLPYDIAVKEAQKAKLDAEAYKAKQQGANAGKKSSGGGSSSGGRKSSGGGGSGSGSKYGPLPNPTTGEDVYFKNENELLRKAAEWGYDVTPDADVSETATTYKGGKKVITTRKHGKGVQAKLGEQARKVRDRFKQQKKSAGGGKKTSKSYANTKKLGL